MAENKTTRLPKHFKFAVIVGLATGLYPIIFYYTNNFSLINSWKHLVFFIGLFVVAPLMGFITLQFLRRLDWVEKRSAFLFSFFNVALFLCFIQLCVYAKIQWVPTLVILAVALLFALFLRKFFKKVIVLQITLALIGLFWLFPTIKNQWTYSNEWTNQPDDIEQVQFKKRPNVYYIQPDGYVNISEMGKGAYNFDNADYWNFLRENGFKIYPNIRSNYSSTLVSNSATFTMKHHYYNNGFNFSEIANARNVIISDNPVLNIFKNNGYKTHFLAEGSYLLSNFPDMGYDVCNFDYGEIALMTDGFQREEDILVPIEKYLNEDEDRSKFFFIEIFKPGHVQSLERLSKGAEEEAEIYQQNLAISNGRLKKIIKMIREKDPNGLILIMADHGGYLGYDYMLEVREKTMDRDRLYSAFSTQLSIKWPDGNAPEIDRHFKSGINTFRILFSYLAEDQKYLEYLQDNSSYTIINSGAPKGVYKCIDDSGNIVFKKH
ncbi:MAG: sulfatase-like hydrolase/transferase [Marinirhabdus sp.]|nr:sulfatase-like hydrolase/transferase [Marinirhabdus sp.]